MALTKIPVGDSSIASAAYYDPEREVMRVEFKNGKNYEYSAVPASKASAFAQADSKGKWLRENLGSIKGVPQHPFSVVPPLDEEPTNAQ